MEFVFDKEKNKEKIESFKMFIQDHREIPGALMPVLQEAQELFGYLPREIMQLISRTLKIPMAEIYGVATFYSQFSFIPKGKNIISVCLGTACYVKGAQAILEEIETILGIKAGSTTLDLKFSIDSTRCVGDCSLAPVIVINDDVYAKVTKNKVKELIEKYRNGV
ncbi:NADH-quinone oxidoreductase subunit NuoE [Sedimentibacter hydroxybenzoicus DSM 7310]|uniref:NADH-quinone oxidoreductase subunit NuoE n=1 Tax=Sedimentibacter hydroxybenzoicus DSM 7310 TaxID=1123245 RepID=A0A974BKS5_SEDHY|nr:NADH-quinone oxidoreductase subunit NuoE [Sedimentibacter hydroxybenzoicus]NYB74567.1 NADH-quinone oxidoreductase subunit NuoE [Sedimentibacter hydroxybenzoicus DSM 7310]